MADCRQPECDNLGRAAVPDCDVRDASRYQRPVSGLRPDGRYCRPDRPVFQPEPMPCQGPYPVRPDRPHRHDASPCSCEQPETFQVGMAYVPWQRWGETYDPHHALQAGTIFPVLDKPWCGMRGGRA